MSDPQNTTRDGQQIVEDLPSAIRRLTEEARQAQAGRKVVARQGKAVKLGDYPSTDEVFDNIASDETGLF